MSFVSCAICRVNYQLPDPPDGICCDRLVLDANAPTRPMDTNLHHFHNDVRFEDPAASGQFVKVKMLRNAIHGKVYLMRWLRPGNSDVPVAVKKMENSGVDSSKGLERSEYASFYKGRGGFEDALNEIGVLQRLSRASTTCPYIVTYLGAFRDTQHTWLTTTFCSGGELFDLIAGSSRMQERSLIRIFGQLLAAVSFIHQHNIGHRDISLENVLVSDKRAAIDDIEVRLMDFGQAVQLYAYNADRTPLRYFHPVGKPYYRPPEAYVPKFAPACSSHPEYCGACQTCKLHRRFHVPCPADGAGRIMSVKGFFGNPVVLLQYPFCAVEGEICIAEPAGYTVAPMDMFALGVCLFIMHAQNPPWNMAVAADKLFQFIQARGVGTLLSAWKKAPSPQLLHVLESLLQCDPTERGTLPDICFLVNAM